ncbi:MAG: transcriptional regulator [Gammaproteobacteria bacterium]|nr:transcriptional regulator [Gammaproteobacteria bacterium]MCF6261572.1 transcriptional regulator [Gammaproteobacteria bacterium]
MTVIKIGIMPQEKIRQRTIAIAKGEYKQKRTDPKIWFPSMKALSEVLSDKNRELLKIIVEQQPESIKVLSEITGRKPNNLSRTLNTLSNYGLVEMRPRDKRKIQPIAKGSDFLIQTSS